MELPEELQERIDIIRHKLKFIEQKPAVACIVNMKPFTLAGNDVSEMVETAGGNPLLTDNLLEGNPDILILMLTGHTIEQTIKAIDQLLQLPGVTELKAVKNNRLYIADGSQYFSKTEQNRVESIEILAEIINPKQFIFGYEGEGWIKFEIG